MNATTLAADELRLLQTARHHAPHRVLGLHREGGLVSVRAWLPGARSAIIEGCREAMERVPESDLFIWVGQSATLPEPYRLNWLDEHGKEHATYDAYRFAPEIDTQSLQSLNEGRHHRAWQMLGAQLRCRDGIAGTRFAVWAPNAERVSVVGDFNGWDGRRHPMSSRGDSGVWELFIPEISAGALYKYEIRNARNGRLHLRADPYARSFELQSQPASVVTAPSQYQWRDSPWLAQRPDWRHAPIAIYEVHLGSWQLADDGQTLNYRELADRLVAYLQHTGFTHVQLMPVTEHPYGGSWGYQVTGYFAPTNRYGSEDDFRYLVDTLHGHGFGVYLDWVPGHFPRDDQALARFDGTALYEHHDTRIGEHPGWGTLVFNYGRNEVRSFLISSALYWLEVFHIDGLRVDAVASMLYLDYGREEGKWLPNAFGGNENLEAIQFLQELNTVTHSECPGTVTVAEESTAWPQVTRPVWVGGLGFSMKWNMGWMNDTLAYIEKDPIHRHFHHDKLTFALHYAFSENFILPLSHDEVVHGKRSMLGKMPGDRWQQFANLRLLYACMYTFPGKKLLFMGNEFGVPREWDHDGELDWGLLNSPDHGGLRSLVTDLNRLYRNQTSLHKYDFDAQGFHWIDCHDAAQSMLCYLRRCGDQHLVVVLNFTPLPRLGYRIGVPESGGYRELLNSDSRHYGGSDVGNLGRIEASAQPWMDQPYSLELSVPPLGALVLAPEAP